MQLFSLAAHYTSGMIFQRNWPILIEGEAQASCEITATIAAAEDKTGNTSADTANITVKPGPFSITLPPREAGRGLTLTLSAGDTDVLVLSDIFIGEVWFASGQSNMQWPLNDTDEYRQNPVVRENEDLRFYTVGRNLVKSPDELDEGYKWAYSADHGWVGCNEDSAVHFSAVAYHFAHTLYDAIKIPIGIINCNVGGSSIYAWIPSNEIAANPNISFIGHADSKEIATIDPKEARDKYYSFLDEIKKEHDTSSNIANTAKELPVVYYDTPGPYRFQRSEILYRSMLERISTFPARGMLWYQGESECSYAGGKVYAEALESLVGNMKCRQNNPDFAFNFVQLAPFYDPGSPYWATVCDQMRRFFLRHPDYAMVTIGDVGCALDIHPQLKRPVGERLAYAAMHRSYDLEHEFTGPIAESAIRVGDEVRVSFIHGAGLHQRPVDMGCFEFVYDDDTVKKVVPELRDNAVYLPLSDGPTPKFVRYEFVADPKIGLYNRNGFPASLFELEIK